LARPREQDEDDGCGSPTHAGDYRAAFNVVDGPEAKKPNVAVGRPRLPPPTATGASIRAGEVRP
jgi:hypothetical protein